MRFLLLSLYFVATLAQASSEGLRVVIERSAPGGLEQASLHFKADKVEVYSNSNFASNAQGETFLGHFSLPYDEKLTALKEMLLADQALLVKEQAALAQLGVSAQPEIPHQMKVYLGPDQVGPENTMAERWQQRTFAVLSQLNEANAVHGVKAMKDAKEKWKIEDLKTHKKITPTNCGPGHCLVEKFGKLVF